MNLIEVNPAAAPAEPLPVLTKAEFVAGFIPPEFLVGDIIQRSYLYSVTARTGHGKTAIALLLTYLVAGGHDLAGRHVERGNVLYLAGENPADIQARMILCDETYAAPDERDAEIIIIPKIFDLATLKAGISTRIEDIGGVALVIVDTGAAYFRGDDDNSNVAMLDFAHILRGLIDLPGKPAVLALMHPIKNADRDRLLPRGGGSFLNEVDGNLTLWSEAGGRTVLHWAGKLRGPGFEPVSFKIETRLSDKLVDRNGRRIPSVVALTMTEDEERAAIDRETTDQDTLLENMLNHPKDSFAQRCARLGWVSPAGSPQKSKVKRLIDELAKHELVRKGRKGWTLTTKGKTEAEGLMM